MACWQNSSVLRVGTKPQFKATFIMCGVRLSPSWLQFRKESSKEGTSVPPNARVWRHNCSGMRLLSSLAMQNTHPKSKMDTVQAHWKVCWTAWERGIKEERSTNENDNQFNTAEIREEFLFQQNNSQFSTQALLESYPCIPMKSSFWTKGTGMDNLHSLLLTLCN